jgi:hypothetical protein
MSIEIKYVLPYREKGKAKTVEFTIDFISIQVGEDYNYISKIIYETQKRWNEILLKGTEIKYLQETKPEGYHERIETLYRQINEISASMKDIEESKVLELRGQLIETILIDNGIEDEKFLSKDFWKKNVEPGAVNDFLETVVFKDYDKKKIQEAK